MLLPADFCPRVQGLFKGSARRFPRPIFRFDENHDP